MAITILAAIRACTTRLLTLLVFASCALLIVNISVKIDMKTSLEDYIFKNVLKP